MPRSQGEVGDVTGDVTNDVIVAVGETGKIKAVADDEECNTLEALGDVMTS